VVDRAYLESIRKIVQKVHAEEQNAIKHLQKPLEMVKIGKVEHRIVQNTKDTGIDIEGYEHEISNYFIRHVLKSHGDHKKEAARGNLPIEDKDFEQIPAIIEHPDYAIFGAKRNGENRLIYIKIIENGTML
jgi:hypothetical protein